MLIPNYSFAAVSAELNRDTINILQTARLIIKTDSTNSNIAPDLTLLSQNFNILGKSTSQNISIINGNQTVEKSWIIEIEAKSPGSFTIPPISVGKQKTHPLRLTVLPEPSPESGEKPDIFLEFELSENEVYVQQQVLASVKLYLDVQLLDGSLTDPTTDTLEIRRMGQDDQYQETVNGRSYQVVERQYALFPTTSGTFDLPAIRFQGVVQNRSATGSNAFSNLFNQGSRVSARSKPLQLKVNPPPVEFTGRTWLPAKKLTIEDLTSQIHSANAGEPFTLKLKIEAVGLSAEQLPQIGLDESAIFKQYPDKPVRQTWLEDGNIVSSITQNIAIIGNGSGNITLPEIRVDWWNTEEDTANTTTLAPRTIEILSQQPAITNPTSDNETKKKEATISDKPNDTSIRSLEITNQTPQLFYLLIGLLLLAWLLTLWLLFKEKRKSHSPLIPPTGHNPSANIKQLEQKIIETCKQADAAKAHAAIKQWSKTKWPQGNHFGLIDRVKKTECNDLVTEVSRLDQVCYSGQGQDWSGDKLVTVFKNYLSKTKTSKPAVESSLPHLYPTK